MLALHFRVYCKSTANHTTACLSYKLLYKACWDSQVIFMAALHSRCGHCIFVLFLSFYLFFLA